MNKSRTIMEALKQISPSCVSTNQLCWRNFRCNSRKRSELERILGASSRCATANRSFFCTLRIRTPSTGIPVVLKYLRSFNVINFEQILSLSACGGASEYNSFKQVKSFNTNFFFMIQQLRKNKN